MVGNSDKFKVKKPNLNKSSDSVVQNTANVENVEDATSILTGNDSPSFSRFDAAASIINPAIDKTAEKTSPIVNQREVANQKKNMIQTGYRIREEYVEALRLQGKREERKIESVLDEILSNYFDSDEKRQKYLETAYQILQIKLSY